MGQILPRKLHVEADVEADAHKELFLRYYRLLFSWALRLTDGSRALAEDLLHDAFVHFVLSRTDLNSIDNIEGYLCRLLVNLFRTQMRKAAQMRNMTFNIADYDSAKLGLHAIDFQARWQAQEDLIRICHYACVRKETSRAGSVLILRFFYDYSPSEIAMVTLSPRRAVDDWLRHARREARFYLDNPEGLKFMAGKQEESHRFKTKTTKYSDDIVFELREFILRSGRSDCLSEAQLRALYRESGQADKTIDCATLGHIVSCARCLDLVNHLLGLPSLLSRQAIEKGRSDPDEPDGSDKNDGGGTGAGSGPSKAFIDRCEEQIRQIREHRPEELLFSANGDPIGALKVNSELSELRLSIHDQSPLEFIEVHSERGMRLIMFSLVHGENAPLEQRAQIELSEGRRLELSFKLGCAWPSLHVIYRDPLLQEINHALNDEPIGTLTLVCNAGPLSDGVESVRLESGAEVAADTAEVGSERLITRLSRRLRGLRLRPRRDSGLTMLSIFSELQAAHGEPTGQLTTEPANAQRIEDPRFKELKIFELGRAEDLIRGPLWRRPGLLTIVSSVLLISSLFYLWMPGTAIVNASGLLERARSAEEKIDRDPNIVQHRTLDLEERRPSDGRVISRSRIEVWHSGAHGVTARRLHDQNNHLIAGEWSTADGTRKVYRQKIGDLKRKLEVWQLDLSAREFSTLIKQVDAATVEERGQTYVINYQSAERRLILPSAELTKATITLSKQDLHTIEQTLVIEQASETREFRLTEASYEQHTVSEVSPSVFEPELELLGNNVELKRRDKATAVSLSPSLTPVPPSPATAELEVEVIRLLNRVHALSGEQLDVERTANGLLRIEGIIDTEERKQEIVRALDPVSNHPSVKIRIETPAEATKRQAWHPSRVIIDDVRVPDTPIPAYPELLRHFTELGTRNDQIDRVIIQYSNTALSRSRRATGHLLAMKEIAGRFSPEQLSTLDERSLSEWRTMIREHAQAFQDEATILRRELEPIFLQSASFNSANETQIGTALTNDAELTRAVGHLVTLWSGSDESVREAFMIRTNSPATITIKLPQFWLSLRSAESLAALIHNKIQTVHR
jgi:DNA-directed RNA polymerase specialized sigma24 family protein